ncbi:MAG: type III secretion system export apparatus subunit SctT [Burkholderiaceae bacterium]|nr:type III secretion system export apparatus subunit SctT [Burkholderiaceae bacterium]
MDAGRTLLDIQDFVTGIAYTQPRMLAVFATLPMFNQQALPGLVRLGIAGAFGALVAPTLAPTVQQQNLAVLVVMGIVMKEAVIGFVIGYALASPFWELEAVGSLVDNQRGATIAATLNPLTGDDTSPLGIMFNQAFIVFFFICGGFLMMLGIVYDSYLLWPVFDWRPQLRPDTVPLLLAQLDRLMSLTMLLAAPVVLAMFLAELGLALVSRFVPQLQVFFLAMPIKSALAMLVLAIYMATLFHMGRDLITETAGILPFLREHWR